MNIQEILAQLKEKFGDSFDISKVTTLLQGLDLKNLNLSDIISKLNAEGLLKNDDLIDSLKNKAGGMLGNLLGKK